MRMVSRTDIEKTSLETTGTYPTNLATSLCLIVLMLRPFIRMSPEERFSILLMHLMSVDLPTPFGPTTQYSPGRSILRFMSRMTVSPMP